MLLTLIYTPIYSSFWVKKKKRTALLQVIPLPTLPPHPQLGMYVVGKLNQSCQKHTLIHSTGFCKVRMYWDRAHAMDVLAKSKTLSRQILVIPSGST